MARAPRLLAFMTIGLAACGYSQQEWNAELDKYGHLSDQHKATQGELAQAKRSLEEERHKTEELMKQLEKAGWDIKELNKEIQASNTEMSKLHTTLDDLEKALAEYKVRAKQLEQIKSRFELLRKRLDELTKFGLAVTVRNNRVIITLPGDVLFDSGKDQLRPDGQEILKKVSGVIRSDPTLSGRSYQVAGHTDNKPLGGGKFGDNWGLSVMRARQVLLSLTAGEGALPRERWSAAGYADTDPVAPNDTAEGRQKNRRCELVILPSIDEMLDLKTISQ